MYTLLQRTGCVESKMTGSREKTSPCTISVDTRSIVVYRPRPTCDPTVVFPSVRFCSRHRIALYARCFAVITKIDRDTKSKMNDYDIQDQLDFLEGIRAVCVCKIHPDIYDRCLMYLYYDVMYGEDPADKLYLPLENDLTFFRHWHARLSFKSLFLLNQVRKNAISSQKSILFCISRHVFKNMSCVGGSTRRYYVGLFQFLLNTR